MPPDSNKEARVSMRAKDRHIRHSPYPPKPLHSSWVATALSSTLQLVPTSYQSLPARCPHMQAKVHACITASDVNAAKPAAMRAEHDTLELALLSHIQPVPEATHA